MTDGKICVRCRSDVGPVPATVVFEEGKKAVHYAGTTRRYTISNGDIVCEECLGEWKEGGNPENAR